jgi:hypothetical protein
MTPKLKNHKVSFKSDEVIIQLDNMDDTEILAHAQIYPKLYLFKISRYFLTLSSECGKNCLCKHFTDGTMKYINAHPKLYLDSLRKKLLH